MPFYSSNPPLSLATIYALLGFGILIIDDYHPPPLPFSPFRPFGPSPQLERKKEREQDSVSVVLLSSP